MEAFQDALSDEQKRILERMLLESREVGRDEARAALRSTVAGSRKPDAYDPTTETLAKFLKRWEPFSKAMGLSDESSIITLITYLDKDTQAIIEERNLGTLENWGDFKRHLLEAAKAPASKYKARQLLLNTRQESGEDTVSFVKRLNNNVEEVHGAKLSEEMEETAKDLLIKGLKNRDLRKDIIKNPTWSFREAITYVRDMAATEEVLDLDKGSTEVEVSVMQVKNEYAQKQHRVKGDYWMERRCYSCGMTGHLRRDCYMNARGGSYNSQTYRYEGRPNDRYRSYGYQNYRRPNAEPGKRNRFPRELDRRYNQHRPHFNAMNNNNRYSHQTPHAHPRPSRDSATPREFRPKETSRKVYSVQHPVPCQEEVEEHAPLDQSYPDLEMYQLICSEKNNENEAQGNL